jgi:hypothetical protein
MAQPRKYANPAERNRAYRLRKKLRENQQPPELDDVARALHRLYKSRALKSVGYAQQLVGKTPYETLLRVVVYELLFDRHLEDGDSYELPPLDKLILPMTDAAPGLPSWLIYPDSLTPEAETYISRSDRDEQPEPEPEPKRTKLVRK